MFQFATLIVVLVGFMSLLSKYNANVVKPTGYLWYFSNCDTTASSNFFYSLGANSCYETTDGKSASKIVVSPNDDGTTTYNFNDYANSNICVAETNSLKNSVTISSLNSCSSGSAGTYYQSGSYSLPQNLAGKGYVKLEFYSTNTCSPNDYPIDGAIIFPINSNGQFDCISLDATGYQMLAFLFGQEPKTLPTTPMSMKLTYTYSSPNDKKNVIVGLDHGASYTVSLYSNNDCTGTTLTAQFPTENSFQDGICTPGWDSSDTEKSPLSLTNNLNGFTNVKASLVFTSPTAQPSSLPTFYPTSAPNIDIAVGVGVGIGVPVLIFVTGLLTYLFIRSCYGKAKYPNSSSKGEESA